MVDTREAHTIHAPRIEVALIPAEDGTLEGGPYEAWMILHVPDGNPPATVLMDGGPWDMVGQWQRFNHYGTSNMSKNFFSNSISNDH